MQQVLTELQRLQARSRGLLILQRASTLLAWTLAIGMGVIALDYVLRLPATFRLVLLLGGLSTLGYFIWGYLRSAIVFAPSLTQLALRVEQTLPAVAGRLASSVEFATAGVDQSNPMAARTVRDTQSRLAGESMASVMATGRTWRDVSAMTVIAAAILALAAWNPAGASTGVTRLLLPFGDAEWPARTGVQSLMSQVVTTNGVFPRGQVLPLRAGITRGEKDQAVDAYYRLKTDAGLEDWQHIVLTHQGEQAQNGAVHERLIDTNAQSVDVYFATDDDRTDAEHIELVPPPAVNRATLTVTPPAYAAGHVPTLESELGPGIDERSVTDTASLSGSRVSLRLVMNKPLAPPRDADESVRAEWLGKSLGLQGAELPQFSGDPSNPAIWQLEWTLTATRALNLSLTDQYGLSNPEPITYKITATEDRPPSVTILQPQADQAVLPTAIIGLEAEARDDVALAGVGVEARVQTIGRSVEDAMSNAADWSESRDTIEPTARTTAKLDLSKFRLQTGDVVLVNAVAKDGYVEASGDQGIEASSGAGTETVSPASAHIARSAIRRLRITSEVEFATQLRRQLAAVRQNAIRIEALQGELQDDVSENGVPENSGLDRAQAQLGERIAGQRQSIQDVQRMLQENKLNDPQLQNILQQTQDLLDHAGRASSKAVEGIQSAQQKGQSSKPDGLQPEGSKSESSNSKGEKSDDAKPEGSKSEGSKSEGSKPDSSKSSGTKPQADDKDAESKPADSQHTAPITEAQQEVRDELTDLIKLLDRDEDTWVARRQMEGLLQEQKQLEQETSKIGEQTIGQNREQLPEQQQTALDRAARKQDDLRDKTRQAIEEMRKRAENLEKVDPQSAQGMRDAANTAEQQQLDRDQDEASKKIQQNQMRSAQANQQSASSTMQKMLDNIQNTKRAQTAELIRKLASLIESITRLITVQENELTGLAKAKADQDFTGLDRGMIRLNQNTQAVEAEARTAGQDARRVSRSLDRAADAQGAAIKNLRAQPVLADDAEGAETRSLELLNEAKTAAEELQKKTQEEEVQRRREELIASYRKFAEQQVAVRTETLDLTKVEQLDRRQLVTAHRLGSAQDDIRKGLGEMRDVTSEILDSPIFAHTHRLMQDWSIAASESLQAGTANVEVTDRQQLVADSIGRIISAIEESMSPPDEFAREEQNQENQNQGGQQQQQPLIPPVAQLKLLRGLQEQVYDQTRTIDGRQDLDAAQRRLRLRDLGQQQRDLQQLGRQMLDALKNEGGMPGSTPDEPPGQPGEPGPAPAPGGEEPVKLPKPELPPAPQGGRD